MAVTQVDDNLRTLHKLLKESGAAAVEQVDSIVSDLTQVCLHEVSGKDLDYCCSVLFDKEIGVVTFLQKIVLQDKFQNVKASLLDLLSNFIVRVEKKILPYAADIKDVGVSLFSRDKYAKVKNAAIPLLIKLLEVTVGSGLGEELKVAKIIDKFMKELMTNATKLAASVKAGIYHLLGVIAEVYPEHMTAYSDRLMTIYLTALKTEMTSKTKKPEMMIIAGCLEGLTCFLTNFTHSAQEDSKNAFEVFKYVKMAIDPNVDFSRYDTPRAGLRLLSRHADQLGEFLLDDYLTMYERLRRWSQHNNREVMHLGMAALEAVLKEITESLVRNAEEGQRHGAVFKFFFQEFRTIMNDPASSAKQMSLAIRGYGLLAAPCQTFLTAADVQFMFNEMVTKSEQQFLGTPEDLEDKLYYLASYLYSLGNIIKHVDDMSDSTAASVERLLVLQLESIPLLNPKMHFDCLRSLVHVLLALRTRGAVFSSVLSGLVYQGLIRTCSHPVVEAVEAEELVDGMQPDATLINKPISYRDFLPVWTGLLNSPKLKMLSAEDMGMVERHSLTEALYDELMAAVLKVISKLDLSATADSEKADEGSGGGDTTLRGETTAAESADPTHGIQANKPQDHVIFINLVAFCRDLLPACQTSHFERWVFILSHNIISLSSKHPLVSGFYKLLSVAMVITKKLNFFKGLKTRDEDPAAMEVDEDKKEDIRQKSLCFLLIKKFSKEVLVRVKQYQGDLLAACLTLVLSLPKEVIVEQLNDVVPAIQVALTVGLSYLPLALTGLEALEYLSEELPGDLLAPLYPQLLPCLDPFLRTADRDLDESTGVTVETTRQSSKSKTPVRLKENKNLKPSAQENQESQLGVVRTRVLQYLGKLGGAVNHHLLARSQEDVSRAAIAWDTTQHIRFDMPFMDMKPSIFFDPFLPRVVELATTSSERQTRVAACELLHSLILYMLGRSAAHPGDAERNRASMQQLYKKLFPAVLQLACEVEQVCQQLFEPLTMQLIHWFTNAKAAESPETMALLDAIYDGVVQPNNTALRDFSARCLREFMAWAIKQSPKKASGEGPATAKSLLRRMFSFALHPSAMKRLGAALTFNNIYTVFREEEVLVDRFTFQILVHFVESLAIAHGDEKALGTQEQCVKALEHLQRIISVKAAVLAKESKHRTEPKEWSKKTLDIAVRWLTRQCGRPQTECRHACMKLVFQLAPLIQGIKSTQDYFKVFQTKSGGPTCFIERFEGGGSASPGKSGLAGCPTLDQVSSTFSLSAILDWTDMLLAVLDCYTWTFGEGLLVPAEVLAGEGGKKTKAWEGLQYFLDKLALASLHEVAALFPGGDSELFTPREEEVFNRAKCTVIVRLWNFLTTVIAKFPNEAPKVMPGWLWEGGLWQILGLCVLQPQQLGFNLGDVEIMDNLPKEMSQVLMVLTKRLPENILKTLRTSLGKQLHGDREVFGKLPLPLDAEADLDVVALEQLVSGYSLLLTSGLLLPALGLTSKTDQLAQKVFSSVFQGIVKESDGHLVALTLLPSRQSLAAHLLELAFQLQLKAAVLVDALLDRTVVMADGERVTLRQGDLFFSQFKATVATQIAQTVDAAVKALSKKATSDPERVSAILVATVDHVARDRNLRKKCGDQMATVILEEWKNFSSWWKGDAPHHLKSQSLLLLTKLILIHSKVASDSSHPAHKAVFEMYLSMLSDSQSGLPFKNRVLDLLPFFAVVKESKETEMLKEALDGLVANNFPLRSSELVPDSPSYNDYIGAIDKLLSGLELSGSPSLLELLISIVCREPRHAHEEPIQAALARFTRRLPQDKQKTALDVPFGIFAAEGRFPLDIRRATLERVCLPMLRLVRVSALKEFFLDHITEIMKLLESKIPRSPEAAVEAGLVSHLCCFQLLELLYSRLERDDVNSKNSIINDKFTGGTAATGKELTQKATKAAHEARSEDVRGETTAVELRRQHHCHAHNLLIAIITCVQTEPKFYEGFLFKDNPAKGQFILESIVDTNRKYEFKVELTAPMERKKRFVSLRHEARQKRRGSDDDDSDDLSSASTTYNLASLYLAESSLSEDLNQFDFSMSGTGQSASGGEPRPRGLAALRKRSSARTSSDDQDTSVAVVGDFLELEVDDLNQHECMAPLVALLRHLISAKIYPTPAQGSAPSEMPGWMQGFYKTFCSAATHANIKLFVAKLITNTAQVFEPYASFWLRPLCQLLVGGEAGEGINTLVVDVLVTLLSWHSTAIPKDNAEERALASRVVEFLMANIYHETRPIFRNNLELLKTVLECWQARLDIPYNLIYKELAATESRSKNDCVGIQILGAVVAAKFPAYGPIAPVDRERYILTLAKGMTKSYKAVFAAAAEVVGMVLRQLEEREKLKEGDIHDEVAKVLTSLSITKPTNFIVCLHCIQRHYAPLADRFLSKLLFILPKLHGEMRTQSLEVVLSRIDQLGSPYLELKSKGLHSFLAHRDEATQSVALKIVQAISAKLTPSDMLELMPVVTDFAKHPSASCRSTMYNILMWIYDNYRTDTSAQGPEVMYLTKDALLRGMAEEDLRCRLLVQNFWSSEARLPGGTVERLASMLEALYSPTTESQFLSYATGLLMEMTSKSPDYNRPIFEHPLSECKFQDISIKADWRQRHAVMTPLFASTLASQTEDSGMGEDSLDGQLRATMDAQQFSATQGGSRGPYNWLTQSSLDTFSETAISLSLAAASDSSLLFTTGSQEGRRALKARPSRPRPGFGKKLSAPQPSTSTGRPQDEGDGKKEEQQSEIWRLKRRFIRDQEASQIYFARRTSRLKQMREEAKKEQQARRENQVTLYRKYRIGDLPDIQIHYSYIIAPLQALAHHDNSVAQLLFGSVFKAIFKALETVKTETEMDDVKRQMNRSLENALCISNQYFTPFMACLLDILYELRKDFKSDSSNVVLVANKSNLQALGIMVLEEQIIAGEAEEPAAKRSRSHAIPASSDSSIWFELARLYKSLRNYDVLQGIFSYQKDTKGMTLDAMAAEARGDFKKAKEFYDSAINTAYEEDKERLQYEEDFWDEGRMECLNKLAKWDDLEEVVVSAFAGNDTSDLNSIWECNNDLQAACLPMLMRAKVKLLLQGESDQQPLLDFVDAAMQVPDRRLVLETWYPLELSLLHVWQEDHDRARFFCSQAAQGFLQTWSSTDALMTDRRAAQVQRLQLIHELHEFLQFMAEQKVKPSKVNGEILARCWKRRLPHPLLDSTSTWDDVITNRSVYLDQMSAQTAAGLEPLLEEVRVQQCLAMVEACRQQSNFARSLHILKETHAVVKGNEELLCEWSHLYATVHHTKYSRLPFDSTAAATLFTTLDQLEKCKGLTVLGRRPDLARRQGALWADGCQMLCLGLAAKPDVVEALENTLKVKLANYADCKDMSNKQKVFDSLAEHSCSQLKAAVGRAGDSEDTGSRYTHGAALLALAKYCDKFLRANEDAEGENLITPKALEAFPETVVVCMLRAMKHGNVEARERYPRLLQLVDVFPDTRAAFIRQASEVPSWMFLGWLAQMIALLDKAEASAVHDILLKLAEDYPQAVIYPFRISCEGFNFENSREGPQNKAAVEKLAALLGEDRAPLVGKFISALDQFGQPDMLFKDWADDVAKLLKNSRRNKEAIKERYLEMYNMLIADKPSGSELFGSQLSFLSATANVGFGEYRRKFAETFRKDFDLHFGKDGKKLIDMSPKDFQSVRVKLNAEFEKHKDKRGKLVPPTRLHEYCQWMADFRPGGKAGMLEIPGQYTGLAKPLPEYHVKVAGFDERVLVMSSLRKPKRITIRGNDEQEYHYLVKGGEDLRLDQRIEQLFSVANGILAKDAACSLRNLQLKTYQVIPMTPRVGLIEWISHTIPLKNFLENAMTDDEKKYHDSDHGPARQHQKWTAKFFQPDKRGGAIAYMYQQVYLKYSLSETVKEFHAKENKVPWNLSRRAFHQLSTSPEAFFVLRNTFASSHAALCICQYILGIGDRHLSNFMVNLQTGQMIGIDFGHAFGSATQFLPVPELMPFRLTRQILNVMLPLKAKGLMETTMVHVLRAIRADHDLLLNTMDVFVKEPSLDWLQLAEKQIQAGMEPEDAEAEDMSWYPRQKILFAEKKLKGDKPSIITRDEMLLGHSKSPALKSLVNVVLGGKDSVRSSLPDSNLTEEDQVAALIDQATDPNLLGRVWAGWEAWV